MIAYVPQFQIDIPITFYTLNRQGEERALQIGDIFGRLPDLETPRLRLRRLALADLDDVFAYTSDPEVARYIRRPLHTSRAEAEAYLAEQVAKYERGQVAPWGIEHRGDGTIIGTCGFFYWEPADRRAEIYYALARPYWGQGYMTEAAQAVVAFGFERMALERISISCWAENVASARVIEKLGCQLEGVLRHYIYCKGAFRDARMYSLLRAEYLGARGAGREARDDTALRPGAY
jgi:ribosomal-protein-alanine N-acetyltransferase